MTAGQWLTLTLFWVLLAGSWLLGVRMLTRLRARQVQRHIDEALSITRHPAYPVPAEDRADWPPRG